MSGAVRPEFPRPAGVVGQVERAPRRVRGVAGGRTVLDTVAAHYVWEWPYYPQYHVPLADVAPGLLVDEHREQDGPVGTARWHGLLVGAEVRPSAARVFGPESPPGVANSVRFEWSALDAWFEEDEQVFVHPRSPYVRVDALRSSRAVRVELGGVLLAESGAPVLVFETGLPTRYYFDRSAVSFEHLVPTATSTPCPYKGVTSQYWSVRTASGEYPDLAWSYDFPTRQLLPIAGLVAFYDELVDVVVDGTLQERPITHFR